MTGTITINYRFHSCASFADAKDLAEKLAFGQTLGFKPPNENRSLSDYVACVTEVSEVDDNYLASVAFPDHLFAEDLSGLLTVVFGKISFAPGIELCDIIPSEQWLSQFPGPKHGYEGLRRKCQHSGPLCMAILKPGIGPDLSCLATQVEQLALGGFDLVKDDEICIDKSIANATERLRILRKASGDSILYVQHLTGPAFELKERALRLQDNGAHAFLFCPYTYGLSALQALASDPAVEVPIFVHPALTGIMMNPEQGISSAVLLGLLPRLAGADAVLYPSPYGSIALPKKAALALHHKLVMPFGDLAPMASVPSAGITIDHIKQLISDFGPNVVINAGTGVAKAGEDLASGARAFRNAANALLAKQ